jgi:hypothetical protein
MFLLGLLSPGEQAEIVSIRDNPDGKCKCRVEEMDIRGGKTVAMVIYQGGTFLGLGG